MMPYIQYPGKYKSELNVIRLINLQAYKIIKKKYEKKRKMSVNSFKEPLRRRRFK